MLNVFKSEMTSGNENFVLFRRFCVGSIWYPEAFSNEALFKLQL